MAVLVLIWLAEVLIQLVSDVLLIVALLIVAAGRASKLPHVLSILLSLGQDLLYNLGCLRLLAFTSLLGVSWNLNVVFLIQTWDIVEHLMQLVGLVINVRLVNVESSNMHLGLDLMGLALSFGDLLVNLALLTVYLFPDSDDFVGNLHT